MAETRVDKVAEKIELRDIRRNTSNQIISYGLPEDGAIGYGILRLPAQETLYEIEKYDKTIDRLTDELIQAIPNTEIEIVNQEFLLDQLEAEVVGELPTEFNARLIVNPDENGGWRDFRRYEAGWKKIQFDKSVFGPSPIEESTYTITPELIETGLNLVIKWKLGFHHPNVFNDGATYQARLQRVAVDWRGTGEFDFKQKVNVPKGRWDNLEGSIVIENKDMIPYDKWYLVGRAAVSGGSNDLYGLYRSDTSYFEVYVTEGDTPPAQSNFTPTSQNQNQRGVPRGYTTNTNVSNTTSTSTTSESQTSNPRSGAGSGSGVGSGTTNSGAGAGASGGSPTGAG